MKVGFRRDRLEVTAVLSTNKVLCRCDCGVEKEFWRCNLQKNKPNTLSCGCLRKEMRETGAMNRKHGMAGTRTYRIWTNMISRCTRPSFHSFNYYGLLGVTVCTRWLSFENFFADMGEAPEGWEIDRRDNEGNYEPGNCRWATKKQQAANRRPRGTVATRIDNALREMAEAG